MIDSGMMGSAAAYDMARQQDVLSVTLADADLKRARDVAARINHIHCDRKVKAVVLDASSERAATQQMKGHHALRSSLLPESRPGQGRHRSPLPFCRPGRK